jgi:uncharacterized Tic20 family protein
MSPSASETATPGQGLAVLAESLYLANLLLAPGLAFGILLYLHTRHDVSAPPLARCHLRQTLSASLWAGALLILVNLLILLLGGYRAAYTWLLVILHFVVCHTALVMLGMFGLAKAMAGQCFRYPLVGRPL